uniref:Uncharacterized protein n=1 Tax=Aegilops tauschii subsp. strangulata TaxID=200361 RepID=A0A453HMP3_AEGTS
MLFCTLRDRILILGSINYDMELLHASDYDRFDVPKVVTASCFHNFHHRSLDFWMSWLEHEFNSFLCLLNFQPPTPISLSKLFEWIFMLPAEGSQWR